MDAYHGLFRIDITLTTDREVEHLVNKDVSPVLPDGILYKPDPVSQLAPKFFNHLDILDNGLVYFTDSSYKHTRAANRLELVDGSPRGRLLEYDPKTKLTKVLMCGLHFPNGVQLLPSSVQPNTLILAELTRFRLLKIDISELKNSQTSRNWLENCNEGGSFDTCINGLQSNSTDSSIISIFIDGLTGVPDNLALSDCHVDSPTLPGPTQPCLIIGAGTKSAKPFSLLWTAFQSINLRFILAKLLSPIYWEHLVPRTGLVFVSDMHGKILRSFQSHKGLIALVSEAFIHPMTGDMWIGSSANHLLAILSKENIPKLPLKSG
jgi:hypothetical protein